MPHFFSRFVLLFFLEFLFVFALDGQQIINLKNPSFEDAPRKGGRHALPISGWYDCGTKLFPGETPPDIHPTRPPSWEVVRKPQHGNSYLGLVVRYSDSWESLSQKLETEFEEGKCYLLSVYLARSELYRSPTPRTTRETGFENFIEPVILQIWGGDMHCHKGQLLAKSNPVENDEWNLNEFILRPNANYKYITIEAFYVTPILEAYNGHVLVDNMSSLFEVDCEQ